MAIETIGKITAFSGPMYSNKTGTMIGILETSKKIAKLSVMAFKPELDNRGEGLSTLKSRAESQFPVIAIPENHPEKILDRVIGFVDLIGIDEVQFMAPCIVSVIQELSRRGIDVIAAGLPTDFRGEPFGPMPDVIAIAHEHRQFYSLCTYSSAGSDKRCANKATQTQRLVGGKPAHWNSLVVVVGDTELYGARCPQHHFVPRD